MTRHRVTTRWHKDSAVSEVALPDAALQNLFSTHRRRLHSGFVQPRRIGKRLVPWSRARSMFQALIEGVEIAFGPSTPAPPPEGKCYSQAFFEGMKLCVYGQLKAR